MGERRNIGVTVGSLFSGIGGIDLGFERAGMRVRWQCEIDPFCRRVLRRHWPDVTLHGDVRALVEVEPVDLVCGGFPCQPVSQAAHRRERAEGWLWPQMARVVELDRPRWVVVENPEGLRYANRGLAEILGDLAALGFDAEWRTLRASDVGAPHSRARVWVVAYADRDREPVLRVDDEVALLSQLAPPVPDWRVVPDLRVADGVPDRVLRRSALGNAVVPQVAELVGRLIVRAESIGGATS